MKKLRNSSGNLITQKRKATTSNRSSRSEEFCGKGILKNFAKFIGKHLCQSLFFNKIAGPTCVGVSF